MNNISEIKVKTFSPEEIAEICDTDVEKISDMIKRGEFAELQRGSKNRRDIIGTREDIERICGKSLK